MKRLKSEKFTLPTVYFVTDRAEINELPVGVPFIFGDPEVEPELVRMLEYEVLYQEAVKSGYPFNFKQILLDNGYLDIASYSFSIPTYLELTTQGINLEEEVEIKDVLTPMNKNSLGFKDYIKDSAVYVDVDKLKKLNIIPVWVDKIEKAVHTNIHNFAVYNENMYNKKLDGMYGAIDLVSPARNLIVIDISGSIPKGVSATCLLLSKNLAETFFADLLITGSKSTLYKYEELYTLNIDTIYDENGMDNDQTWFRKLVETEAVYSTAIVFGDNHNPGWKWTNPFQGKTGHISITDGKKICKWEVEKLISFHTKPKRDGRETPEIAGYGLWFEPEEIEHIEDWVKYLNK